MLSQLSGMSPSSTTQPIGPRLQTSVALVVTDIFQRRQRIGAAAGNMELLFCTDH